MRKDLRVMLCLILAVTALFGVGCDISAPPDGETAETFATDGGNTTADVDINLTPEELTMEQSLGLCVTDLMYAENSAAKCAYNYKRFADMGVKTLRLIPSWTSPDPGVYNIDPVCEDMIKAAIKAELRIKLCLCTVSSPPPRILADEGARYMSETGVQSGDKCLSLWYDGITDYSSDAVSCMLAYLKEKGYLDYVDAVVVDCGPANEPLYPAAWTQGGYSGMWCYADNAQTDFRTEMVKKYSDINIANDVWESTFASFNEIYIPAPGETSGALWEDVLVWYRDVKRDFVTAQTAIYKSAVDRASDGRIRLIMYMPGEAYTEADWHSSVAGEKTVEGIKIMSENEFIVETARSMDCMLQFTGLPGTSSVKRVLSFMYDNGYNDIPVYGENVNDINAASDPAELGEIIRELNLAGIDYTTSQFLFKGNYVTPSEQYDALEAALPALTEYVAVRDPEKIPESLKKKNADPRGEVLSYTVTALADSSLLTRISVKSLSLKRGDLLEYDVFIPEGVSGIGQLDIMVEDTGALGGTEYVSDRYGYSCSQTDLSSLSGEWQHRVINLAFGDFGDVITGSIGRDLKTLYLSCRFGQAGVYTAYFDNIAITNGGEVRAVLFEDSGDLNKAVVKDTSASGASSVCEAVNADSVG